MCRKKRVSRGHGIIVGRRCPRIQRCPLCGQMRGNHPSGRLYDCTVPPEVTEALKAFARQHGKRWKSVLCRLWETAEAGELLQQARNIIGPRRLYTISVL